MIREPVVAGRFYSGDPLQLHEDVEGFLKTAESTPKVAALGVVSPHAGYMYSGSVAGAALGQVKIPQKIIVLCPNHTGLGAWGAINTEGYWKTPLGNAQIASELARRLQGLYPDLQEDSLAHAQEHALEVQLPFLQELRPDFEFVPLCLSHFSYGECDRLGLALAQLIQEGNEEILMLASSDLNHYESQERTLQKDQRAIDCILEMDPEKLYRVVQEEAITMCGIIPVTCMLIAARQMGAQKATLVKHTTSGDVTGDYAGVVGYAGIIVS